MFKKYIILLGFVSVIAFSFTWRSSINVSAASTPSDFGLKEGDLISAIFSDDPDVYIVNEHGYKRLFLNPEIFKFYTHLGGFANIKLVTPEIRDSFPTSGFFRNCEDNDQKVFGTSVEGEDQGRLHWINKSGDQAVQEDPDFFKKVFCINRKEFNWYPRGTEYKALKEVPQYHRTEEAEKPVICHHPSDQPNEPKNFQTIRVAPESLDAHFQHGDTKGACSTSSVPIPAPLLTPIPSAIPIPIPTVTPIPIIGVYPSSTASSSYLSTPIPISISSPQATPTPMPTSTASRSYYPTPTPTLTPTPISNAVPITVIYPNGGDAWDVYKYNESIYWLLNGVSRVGFKLLKGSQVVYGNSSPIVSDGTSLHISPGIYGVPSIDYNSIGSGSDYKIRVFDWDHPEIYDDSNGYFSIPQPDFTPPVVSSVLASSITANSATITWTTDEPATGFVNYGSTITNWIVTPTNTTYLNSHSFAISNLTSSTLYSFRVYSVDAFGNGPQGYPPNYTFTTLTLIPTPTPTPATSSVSYDNFSRNIASIAGSGFNRDLYFGSFGSDVKQLQVLLVNEVGYSANLITGYFGSSTQNAVKRLQEKYGVKPVSGYFGVITRKTLNALISQ